MFEDKNIVNVSADPLSFTTTRVVLYVWVKSAAPHFTSFLKGEISVQESLVMTVAEVLSTLPNSAFFCFYFQFTRIFILLMQSGLAPLNSHLCSSVPNVQDVISESCGCSTSVVPPTFLQETARGQAVSRVHTGMVQKRRFCTFIFFQGNSPPSWLPIDLKQ